VGCLSHLPERLDLHESEPGNQPAVFFGFRPFFERVAQIRPCRNAFKKWTLSLAPFMMALSYNVSAPAAMALSYNILRCYKFAVAAVFVT